MKTILVDTSVIIDFLRQPSKKDSSLVILTDQLLPLSISIITHAELYAGRSVWESKTVQQMLEEVLEGLTIVPLSTAISRLSGKLRLKQPLNLPDALIAATALEEHISLVTLNVKHFQTIPRLKLFKLKPKN